MQMYDIIGDIHGYGNTLVKLLEKLGYSNDRGYFYHSHRKAIFAGDLIDRGPNIRKTLHVVKKMVDNQTAHAIMGNHEYNAVCYHTTDKNGNYLREHHSRKKKQIKETLLAFKLYPKEWKMYLEWFKTLPILIDLDDIRIVHACWDFKQINYVKQRLPLLQLKSHNDWVESANERSELFQAIEVLLKGKEIELPPDIQYLDKDGHKRRRIRFQWWRKFNVNETYQSVAVNFEETLPAIQIPTHLLPVHEPYLLNQKPVFIGHYWRKGEPQILTPNVACLDYSVAKNGYLVAYRWDGEMQLNNKKFVKVKASS